MFYFRNKTQIFILLCAVLVGSPVAAQDIIDRFRLGGTEAYFVTPEDADEAIAQSRTDAWSLGTRLDLLEIHARIDRETDLIAFYDHPDGLGTRLPLVLTSEEYFELRNQAQVRNLWPELLRSQMQQTLSNRDPENLLSLDIPVQLPSILGGGQPNFSILGRQRIELSGRSEWTDDQIRTATNRVSRFPSISMRQEQQFMVSGNIGQKIAVTIQQDSQAFSDLDNRIQIRYEDRMDDGREGNGIIKRFEAGNVSLSLENAEFTGYTDQHSGLFGIKLESQLGGFSFTTIMSQEKGEGQSANFEAGTQGSRLQIRDVDYRRRTYFFVDAGYRENFSRRDANGRHLADADSIESIRVFVATRTSQQDLALLRKGVAYFTPPITVDGGLPSLPDTLTETSERADFRELQSNEFLVDRNLGYIALATPLQAQDVLGVFYETRNRLTGKRVTFGEVPIVNDLENETKLRLLKSRNERVPQEIDLDNPKKWGTWQYEWRNVYFLGKTGINPDGFDLKIFKNGASGADQDVDESGVPYIQLLGLDRRGVNPGSQPDRLVDIDYELINFQRGELIFPDLYPFAPGLLFNEGAGMAFPGTQGSGLNDQTPELYNRRSTVINNNIANFNKYYITVEHKDRQAQYSLGRSNVIEGSEVVKLNGRKLVAGSDYIMLYEVGQIRFLTEEAMDPNADVDVNYQFAPFFQPASNTLMGFQSRYDFNDRSWVRGTLLYRSDKNLDQKSRIGRETGRSILWDLDTRLSFDPQFMTSFVNMIPFVESDARSSLDISAEFAQSIPNPNTRGDAFIDDFEGSKEETDLGVRRTGWVAASPPDGLTHVQRGRLVWYNPMEQVPVKEIFPTRQVIVQDSRQHVLTVEFDPRTPDLRWGGTVDDAFLGEWIQDAPAVVRSRWGGVMRPLTGATIDQTRSKFIEVWVNGNEGELNIDLGSISEDVNGNAVFDTEDDRSDGFGNQLLDANEDTGIDLITDVDEVGFDPVFNIPMPYDATSNPDPHGDNFEFDQSAGRSGRFDEIDYSRINGTENNANDPDVGRRPNSEDTNNSGFLDSSNNFYRYRIHIGPDHPDTAFVAGGDLNRANWGGKSSWRMYRIPLTPIGLNTAFNGQVGTPSFALIEAVRIYITDVENEVTIRLGSIQMVGNRWQEDPNGAIVDSLGQAITIDELTENAETFQASVKNTFDNPDDYSPPPGAIVEIDRVTGVRNREQSLALNYENLQPGHNGQVFQTFYTDQDYTVYNELKIFVHGSDHFIGDQSPVVYLRFGNSFSDYYEYRSKVVPGWAQENAVQIIFNDLTLLKGDTELIRQQETDTDTTFTIQLTDGQYHPVRVTRGTKKNKKQAIVVLPGGKEYRVQGRPSLSRIRQFVAGISNPYEHPLSSGEVWIDELRTSNVRKNKGMAGRISVDATFADLATFRGTFRQMGSNYRLIGQPEQGSTTTLLDLNSSMNADRFFPETWGLSMPVRIGWRFNKQLPRLKVGSDILLLRREDREEQRREERRFQLSAAYSKRSRSDNFLAAWTVDRFRVNFATSSNISRTVTREDTSNTYNGSFTWDLTPKDPHTIPLFKWMGFMPQWITDIELRYLPSQLSLDARIDRTKQAGVNRQFGQTRTERFRRNLNRALRGKLTPFRSVSVDYTLNLRNDMRADSLVSFSKFKFGPEIDYTETFAIDVRPEVASWLRPGYSFNTNYRENRNPEQQIVGTSQDDRTISLNNRRSVRSNLNLDRMLTSAFGRPGGSRSSQDGEESGRGVGSYIYGGMRGFISHLNPVNMTLNFDNQQSLFGLRSRPTASYRFGFSDQPGITAPSADSTGIIAIQQDRRTESSSLTIDTGVKLFADITLSTRPAWRTSKTESPTSNIETWSHTWPDAAIRWTPPLRSFQSLTKLIRRIDLSTGYNRKVDTATNINLLNANPGLAGGAETKTVVRSFSPLIQVALDWAFGLSMRSSYQKTLTDQKLGLSSTDQQLKNTTLNISLDYRIQPGFRLFGKMLKGSMNLQTQIISSLNETLIARDGSTFKPSNGQRQLSFRTRSDYQFSRRIRGGLTIEWTNTANTITNEKRRIRQGGFWTEFEFN